MGLFFNNEWLAVDYFAYFTATYQINILMDLKYYVTLILDNDMTVINIDV